MKSNVIAYSVGVGTLCLSMATAFAQTAATPQAPAQQGSSAARATEPAAPAGSAGTPMSGTSSSGTPSMTPSAAEVRAPAQGASDPASGALPAPQQSGGVTYITGGFGDNQANAFKEAGAKHSIMMVFSETGGAYLADIPVQIKAKGDGANVDIKAAGPYLLVDLPDGDYTAQVTHQGKSQTKDFSISGQKGQRIAFTW
jgi:hypothetical protein